MKNAVAWAKANGKTRKNDVHGAEEYRIKTFDAFNAKDTNRSSTVASASVDIQDSLYSVVLCQVKGLQCCCSQPLQPSRMVRGSCWMAWINQGLESKDDLSCIFCLESRYSLVRGADAPSLPPPPNPRSGAFPILQQGQCPVSTLASTGWIQNCSIVVYWAQV